jgi:hypothetical protein
MSTALMNEAERFLIQNWNEARRMEETMEAVRTKYKELAERVIQGVTENHPELDRSRYYVTQFWGGGSLGFGRSTWPSKDGWPSGLWIWNVRLEHLASAQEEPPQATIWIAPKVAKAAGIDLLAARRTLSDAVSQVLTDDERESVITTELEESLLRFQSPSKEDLLEGILTEGGEAFVAQLIEQFDLMAKFIPTLDEIFSARVLA